MKLRNKLIPILGVASTAAAVAPLASCGTISEYVDTIDVLHGYIPTVAKSEGFTNLSTEQVEDLYVDHVKKNPEIFTQDLAWWQGQALKTRLQMLATGNDDGESKGIDQKTPTSTTVTVPTYHENFSDELSAYGLDVLTTTYNDNVYDRILSIPQVAKFGASNVVINEMTLINPTTLEEQKVHTISLDLNYEFEYEQIAECKQMNSSVYATVNRVVKVSSKTSYKNIPFEVYFDSDYLTWMVRAVGWQSSYRWMLAKIFDWQFDFDVTSTCVDTITDHNQNTYTETYDFSKKDKIRTIPELLAWIDFDEDDIQEATEVSDNVNDVLFNFGSYHLFDIAGAEFEYSNLGYSDNISYNVEYGKTTAENKYYFKFDGVAYLWLYKDIYSGNYPTSATLKKEVPLQLRKKGSTDLIPTTDGYINFNDVYFERNNWTSAAVYLYADRIKTETETAILWPEDILALGVTEDLQKATEIFWQGMDDGLITLPAHELVIPKGTTFQFEMTLANGNTVDKSLVIENDIICPWTDATEA